MVEVVWVTIFGLALAWLQTQSKVDEPIEARVLTDEAWTRWEKEIHAWRDSI